MRGLRAFPQAAFFCSFIHKYLPLLGYEKIAYIGRIVGYFSPPANSYVVDSRGLARGDAPPPT